MPTNAQASEQII